MAKLRLAVLFGGKSEEHDVSIMSCASVLKNIDQGRYAIQIIGISKSGEWRYLNDDDELTDYTVLKQALLKGRNLSMAEVVQFFTDQVDVVFPVLHGPFGEDGTIQGFLESVSVPYVGAGVASSVVCMDKAYMKTLLAAEGMPMTPYRVLYAHENREEKAATICKELTFPLFIKPANLGSSVGIKKAKTVEELKEAMAYAFEFDNKIIVEQGVVCRELECGVLGNNPYRISHVGEIIASHEFYDYDAKYFDGGLSQMIVPASIDDQHVKTIQSLSLKTAEVLGVEGLSRIDFFLDTKTDSILFNEINTMPGFTEFSMYPSLFRSAGLSYTQLIDQLIQLALDRGKAKSEEGHA